MRLRLECWSLRLINSWYSVDSYAATAFSFELNSTMILTEPRVPSLASAWRSRISQRAPNVESQAVNLLIYGTISRGVWILLVTTQAFCHEFKDWNSMIVASSYWRIKWSWTLFHVTNNITRLGQSVSQLSDLFVGKYSCLETKVSCIFMLRMYSPQSLR